MKLGLHLAMATEACAIGKVCIDFPGCVCHTHTHTNTPNRQHIFCLIFWEESMSNAKRVCRGLFFL